MALPFQAEGCLRIRVHEWSPLALPFLLVSGFNSDTP
jgi:hypothetical protein